MQYRKHRYFLEHRQFPSESWFRIFGTSISPSIAEGASVQISVNGLISLNIFTIKVDNFRSRLDNAGSNAFTAWRDKNNIGRCVYILKSLVYTDRVSVRQGFFYLLHKTTTTTKTTTIKTHALLPDIKIASLHNLMLKRANMGLVQTFCILKSTILHA